MCPVITYKCTNAKEHAHLNTVMKHSSHKVIHLESQKNVTVNKIKTLS